MTSISISIVDDLLSYNFIKEVAEILKHFNREDYDHFLENICLGEIMWPKTPDDSLDLNQNISFVYKFIITLFYGNIGDVGRSKFDRLIYNLLDAFDNKYENFRQIIVDMVDDWIKEDFPDEYYILDMYGDPRVPSPVIELDDEVDEINRMDEIDKNMPPGKKINERMEKCSKDMKEKVRFLIYEYMCIPIAELFVLPNGDIPNYSTIDHNIMRDTVIFVSNDRQNDLKDEDVIEREGC